MIGRKIGAITLALLSTVVLAACAGSAATPPPTGSAVPTVTAPAPATAATSPAIATAPPAAAPPSTATAPPAATSPTASRSPAKPPVMTSPFYGFRLALPSADWSVIPAKSRWDGVEAISANGPTVDQAYGPGSELFFVYGEPTTTSLDAWAKKGQQQTADWHGCPATPETTRNIVVGGEPATLNGFHCQGLWAQKAFVVRNGFGWAFNELSPPGQEAADGAALADLLTRVEWTR